MMEFRFYKEQQHSYLIINNENGLNETDYQYRMLVLRKPEHILPVSIRNIDGAKLGYYNITSRITLRQMFGGKYLDMDEISKLMLDIRAACESADGYLLNTDRLLFYPDMIYYDFGTSDYSFIYTVSGADSDERDQGISELMDFLIDRVSPGDSAASEYIFSVYECYERGNFDIWDASVMLPDEDSEHLNRTEGADEHSAQIKNPDDTESRTYSDPFLNDSIGYLDSVSDEDPKENHINITYCCLCGIGAVGVIACAVIFFVMKMNDTELMLLAAAAAALFAMLIIGAVMIFRDRMGMRSDREYEDSLRSYIEDEIETREITYAKEMHVKDILADTRRRVTDKDRAEITSGALHAEMPDDGRTIFFDPNAGGSCKLYAMDKKNKQHIALDDLPITIGKLREYADCIIDHPSISRMHARISRTDGTLMLEDLNSTNGVYLNGIRLSPNEKTVIEIGDEIRLGKLNYCLRTVE